MSYHTDIITIHFSGFPLTLTQLQLMIIQQYTHCIIHNALSPRLRPRLASPSLFLFFGLRSVYYMKRKSSENHMTSGGHQVDARGRVHIQIVHDFLIEHSVAWQDVRHPQHFSLVKKKKIVYCSCTSSHRLSYIHLTPPDVFHVISVSGLHRYCHSSASMYNTEHK